MIKKLMLCLTCCSTFFAHASNAQTSALITHQLKPFSYYDGQQLTGFAVDLVQAMQRHLNTELAIKVYPFKRALKQVQKNDNLALFVTALRPDREKTLKWVGPLISSNVYFYKNRSSQITINTVNDAKKVQRIGVGTGNADHVYLQNLGFNNLHPTNTQRQSLQMLNLNRIDLIPVSELVATEVAKQANINLSNIERTNVKLYTSTLYLAFSLNTTDEEIGRWQSALDKIQASQEYQAIYSKYINR